MTYDYPTAFSSWGPEEHAAIDRVIKSVRFTMGEEVAAFEREFADFHGMRHGIMVNSGSSANLVAVSALVNSGKLRRGHKVTVPAVAWSTTYAPLVQHGIGMLLADCDDTWNAHGTDILCSVLGNPAMARDAWLEDNCESLGAIDKNGKRCGTRAVLNTFSFFYSHQLSAIEGGMILTHDRELADLCRMLRAHGWTRDVAVSDGFDDEYDFRVFGYNVRALEIHAAIAREQLKKLPGFCVEREANRLRFMALSRGLPIVFPRPNGTMSSFGIAFTVASSETRRRLVTALRGNNIDCRLPTGGSFRMHGYGRPWRDQQTPNADHIHQTGMFLGCAPYDISDKIERAVKVMREVLT